MIMEHMSMGKDLLAKANTRKVSFIEFRSRVPPGNTPHFKLLIGNFWVLQFVGNQSVNHVAPRHLQRLSNLSDLRSTDPWLLKKHLPRMHPDVFSTSREGCIWEGAPWGQVTVREFGWIRCICPFIVGTKSHTHVQSFSRIKLSRDTVWCSHSLCM